MNFLFLIWISIISRRFRFYKFGFRFLGRPAAAAAAAADDDDDDDYDADNMPVRKTAAMTTAAASKQAKTTTTTKRHFSSFERRFQHDCRLLVQHTRTSCSGHCHQQLITLL